MANVLVLGSGGREQAIKQSMLESIEVDRVVVAANPQTGLEQFSTGEEKPFVIVGPEALLIDGVTNYLRGEGYTVFGATQEQSVYEARKSRAVKMMRKAGIPHPQTYISKSKDQDRKYMKDNDSENYVIKADRPAAGKGSVLPVSRAEARDVSRNMREGAYDGAGRKIINYQNRHHGPEVSDIVVVGANDELYRLALTQDHKRLQDEEKGPNTGGMGAYGPLPESVVSDKQYEAIEKLADKSLWGMRKAGVPYERAALYSGLMLADETGGNPEVIEYNVRFGDPEAQVQFLLGVDAGIDMYRLLRSAAEGDLETPAVDFRKCGRSAITVYLAAYGYPDSPEKGNRIWGLENNYPGVVVQAAAVEEGKTSGGRVLSVTAIGDTINEAAALAYNAIDLYGRGPLSKKIGFVGMQARQDIGWQAMTTA